MDSNETVTVLKRNQVKNLTLYDFKFIGICQYLERRPNEVEVFDLDLLVLYPKKFISNDWNLNNTNLVTKKSKESKSRGDAGIVFFSFTSTTIFPNIYR